MADPNAPDEVNIFDQLSGGPVMPRGSTAPTAVTASSEPAPEPLDEDNVFNKIAGGQVWPRNKPTPDQSSGVGSFVRGAVRGIVPSGASLAAAGAGAEVGGEFGALAGPFGAAAGALVGGIGGALVGGWGGETAQDYALSKAPDSWVETIGQDDRQRKLDEALHPYATFLGGLTPYALTMRPGAIKGVALPENATALQRIMANPVTARVFGGAAMGGMELGQEAAQGNVDWNKVAISTAFGVVFNKPTRIGEAITEMGAKPARAGIRFLKGEEAPIAATPEVPSPTIAQAGDAKVMGPGITEDVFHGSHEQDPSAAMAAQEALRTEQAAIGETAPQPDIGDVARRMHHDLFTHYDDLIARRNTLLSEEHGPVAALAATNAEINEIAPEIAAAYRRAADAVGAETVEPTVPAPAETAVPPPSELPNTGATTTPPSPEVQRAAIVADVTRQLTEAGRPQEEAYAAAQIVAARYEARAMTFGGKLGTAEEMYRRDAARIVGQQRRPSTSEVVEAGERARTAGAPRELTLIQHLAASGGLKRSSEVTAALGGENPFIPGIGRLVRKEGGMSVDAALRHAEDAGYISEPALHQGGPRQNDVNTLLDLLGKEHGGAKQYPIGREPAEIEDAGARLNAIESHVRSELESVEVDPEHIDRRTMDRIVEMVHSGQEPDALVAYERAVMEISEQDEGHQQTRVEHVGSIPGWDLPAEPIAAREAGLGVAPEEGVGAAQGERAGASGGTARHAGEGDRQKVGARELAQSDLLSEIHSILKSRHDQTEPAPVHAAEPRAAFVDPAAPEWKLYHGTASPVDFERFRPDVENTHRLSAKPEQRAIFLTPSPKEAAHYAESGQRAEVSEAGPRILPLKVTPGKTRIFDLADMMEHDEHFRTILRDLNSEYAHGPTTAEDRERLGKLFDERLQRQIDHIQAQRRANETAQQEGVEPKPITVDTGLGGASAAIQIAHEDGLDTAVLRGLRESLGGDQIAVLTPGRVRGAISDAEMFQGARGKIRFVEGARPTITLMRDANASTFIHESGHEWLEQLMRDAEHELAPDELKADAQTTLKWLGVETADAIKTRQHEKFARGFEQYLREGVAPSPGLASVFAKFKNWLLQIYQTLKGLGQPINEDIRGVFDRMLAAEPQRTVIAPERAGGPRLADIHEADAALTEPHEAAAAADRIAAERERYVAEPPPEIAHEIAPVVQEVEAQRAAAAGTEPGTETGEGAAGQPNLEPGGAGGEPVPPGGGVGEGRGTVGGSGSTTAAESAAGRGSEPSGRGADANAGGQPLAPSPAKLFGPDESPFTDRAGNIRVENLTTREDVAHAIRDAARENNDFVGSTGGTVTDGQVMELAEAIGMPGAMDLVQKRVHRQAMNAEQVMALRKLLIQSATDVSSAMKKAALGADADVIAYAIAKDRHQMIQGVVAGVTAEAGRALRAFRNISGENAETRATNEFIKTATGKTLFQLQMEAKLGAHLDSAAKVSKFLEDAKSRSFGRMVLEYWINGLISGPATHTTYMVGNALLAAMRAGPETATAALIGQVRQAMGREGNVVHMGEVGAQFRGALRGLPGGIEAALEAMRTGMTTLLPGETARPLMPFQGDTSLALAKNSTNDLVTWKDVGAQSFGAVRGMRDGLMAGAKLIAAGGHQGEPLLGFQYSPLGQIPDIAIRGVPAIPIGSAIRVPGRFIAAIHSFFRATNYSMIKSALAYRMATDEIAAGTIKASDFNARVGDLWQNPPEAEIMEPARQGSTEATLMGQGSAFVQALAKLTNTEIFGFPLLKFIDPFVHIAGNVIDQSIIQRTPVGLLAPEIRADIMGKNGNIAQDTAMAKMIVGTALSVTFGGLAAQGLVTGSGPQGKDANETRNLQAVWRAAGYQPYSIRIGDMLYDTHRLGPMGMLMGIAADLYDVAHAAEKGEFTTAAAMLQHAFVQNIVDESFMRGPADLIQAVEDPGRYGEAYLRNFASSFVPFSVGMAQIARAADPYTRQARSIADAIRVKVPGLSEGLMPRRDIWGEMIPSREALIAKGVTAIYMSQISKDPVNVAMVNLGVAPAQLERKIRNIDLTDQQYDDFSRLAGRMAKQRLDTIVLSPDFQTWPNHTKADVVKEVITQSREAARGMMMLKYPSIADAATRAKIQKINGPSP